MQFAASDRFLLGVFAALAVASIGLKAVAGPPRDGWTDQNRDAVTGQLRRTLAAQGFSTSVRPLKIETSIVFAQRGGCRMSVRDARGGAGMMTQFARDAASIGPVRYLYKGDDYNGPPALRMRLGRFETELLGRIAGQPRAHIPVAVAKSRGCGATDFGLGDVSIAA